MKRDLSLDNLRFFLIFTVVFGHLLEVAVPFRGHGLLYQVIYSFHMPAFLFLFGYCARFSPRRIVFHCVIPYFIFQSIFLLAQNAFGVETPIQYTTPYWILWYLVACIYYLLLIPIYDSPNKTVQILVFAASVALALLVGFVDWIEYPFSLSRFFVFQPWFILGFYCRKGAVLEKLKLSVKQKVLCGILLAALICVSVLYLQRGMLQDEMLYGTYPYSQLGYTLWTRLLLMAIAFCWLVVLFVVVKPLLSRRLPLVTAIGQNTLPVFLLHGFFTRPISILCPEAVDSFALVLALTCAILLLLGNRWCKKLVEIVGLSPLERILPQKTVKK